MSAAEQQTRVSTSTPAIAPRDAALFRILIEPAERKRPGYMMARSIGDVLDLKPPDAGCHIRQRWFSPGREQGGIVAKACGQRTCAVCVVGWLSERAGRAWAYWKNAGLTVDVQEYESAGSWKWEREKVGWKMQGDSATPGVLDLPHVEGRLVFIPEVDGLRGHALDEVLVTAIRAIPVPPFRPQTSGEPNPNFGLIPRWMSTEQAVQLARSVGLAITVASHQNVRYNGTLEQTQAWIDLMRKAA